MRRHPFDPISLVCGLLFVTAGTIVLLGGSLAEEGAFLAPAGLIALGLAFLHQARRRASQARRSAAGGATAGTVVGGEAHGGGEDRGPGGGVDGPAGGA